MKYFILALLLWFPLVADTPPPPGYYSQHHLVWYDRYDRQGSPWLWGSVDKREHFGMGVLVGSWCALEAEHLGSEHPWVWGLVGGAIIGIYKEWVDYTHRPFPFTQQVRGSGTAEVMDAVWTAVGGAVGGYTTIRVTWGPKAKTKIKVGPR